MSDLCQVTRLTILVGAPLLLAKFLSVFGERKILMDAVEDWVQFEAQCEWLDEDETGPERHDLRVALEKVKSVQYLEAE